MSTSAQMSYIDGLLAELDRIEQRYVEVIERSETYYDNPNQPGGVLFIGAADYYWKPSSPDVESARMALLAEVRNWEVRFGLLLPHPTPQVAKRHKLAFAHLVRWLARNKGNDHSLRRTTAEMIPALHKTFTTLRDARQLLPVDDYAVRLVIDTNALIDNPDVAAYTTDVGSRYMVHIPPIVLRELDDLKRAGRTPELREAAARASRRLKGHRLNGDILTGVRVAGDVSIVFEHSEPQGDGLPSWLDLDVPDDRVVASALLLQSRHPGSRMTVVTSDISLQTRLSAAGLPFIEGGN